MATIGIVSKDVMSKGRIMEALQTAGMHTAVINNALFDGASFDTIFVDLNDPSAMLVIKNHAYKCIAFAGANEEAKIKAARLAGCERIYKHGEFFKKILPNFKV